MVPFPSFDLSRFELPRNVSLPEVDVDRAVDVARDAADRAVDVARDAAYVGIGVAVLTVQQAQVRRRELQEQLERGVRAVRDRVA